MSLLSSKTMNERRLRKKPIGEDDKISQLPDDILCHILSFIPSKEACATSLLSTRWRSLWTMVPVVHFNGYSTAHVNQFLKQRKITHTTCVILEDPQCFCDENMDTWISSFIAGNVEHLKLTLDSAEEPPLPTRLFTCGSLVTLKLKGSFFMNVPSYVHLPCLKTLHLKLEVEQDIDSLSTLLSGCPILEVFHMWLEEWGCDDLSFVICVPSLKKLKIVAEFFVFERLEINTPCLESLHIRDCDIQDLVIEDMKNLVKVNYHVVEPVYLSLQLLTRLGDVQSLSLGDVFNEVMMPEDFPQFNHLVHLQLTLGEGYLSLHLLQLLTKCPKLQVLVIEREYGYQPKYLYPADSVSLFPHLSLFEYRGYDEDVLPLVAYILRSAKAIRIMKIKASNVVESKKIQLHKQISKLLISSPCVCQFN